MKHRYITIYRRAGTQPYWVRIAIPREHRAIFLRSPLAGRLGFKPDAHGRIRRSMGKLRLRDIERIADRWERQIDEAILRSLDADLGRVLRTPQNKSSSV